MLQFVIMVIYIPAEAFISSILLCCEIDGGCNGIRTHIGDFTRPLTADSLPIRFHTPIEIGGSEGSRTLYLSACKADAFTTLEPRTQFKWYLDRDLNPEPRA